MNNNESGKYTNSMLQDIMKKHAPVNESNERKVDESAFDWTRTLAYLTQILSRAKEARQAQLILGEALTKICNQKPTMNTWLCLEWLLTTTSKGFIKPRSRF